MSAVDLLEPILDGGLQRNNFFNGRLLSAEDLRAEQDATRTQAGLLARAQGDGVAWGLAVTVLDIGMASPRIAVTAGLALNRFGDLLRLRDDAEVTLVPGEEQAESAAGLFAACESPRPAASFTGEGAYVLVIAPSSGFTGTALVSDPNTTAVGRGTCGARFTVEGIRFRMVPIEFEELERSTSPLRARVPALLAQDDVPARERVRNLLAHACFGSDELPTYFTDPLRLDVEGRPYWSRWGLLDAMRSRNDITGCDVPLAIVVFSATGIRFVDSWSARRRLVDAAAINAWRGVAGPRRIAECEAAFLQFQLQLEELRAGGAVTPASIAASAYFDVLPAAGRLPIGSGGFNWQTFLGPHAPPAVTQVDEALLRGIVERSWFLDPFRLDTSPPVPLHVYQVPGAQHVVFARSENGNIRVQLTPAPTSAVEATATAATGIATKGTAHAAGILTIPHLAPGSYTVRVNATGYQEETISAVAVVGGRTTGRNASLTLLPDGWITVTARHASTNADIGHSVASIVAERSGTTYAGVKQSNGKWRIGNLPNGTYTVRGTAPGYVDVSSTGAAVTQNSETARTLAFHPVAAPQPQRPELCVTTAVRKPPIGRVEFCMVLDATEFDYEFYYGDRGGDDRLWILSGEFRTGNRRERERDRSISPTGEILYYRPPWSDMEPLELDDSAVDVWLHDWRTWFGERLQESRLEQVGPQIYMNMRYRVPTTSLNIPETPWAYAVFGLFGVPLEVRPLDHATRGNVSIEEHVDTRGMPRNIFELYERMGIRYVNDLAFAWMERLHDIGGELINPVRHQIYNAFQAAQQVNEAWAYLEGMTEEVRAILVQNDINDDVALANADPMQLAELLGSESFAIGLIFQARALVPRESWSLEGAGLTQEQAHMAAARGIESMGVLAAMMNTEEGREAVAETLGIRAGSAEAMNRALDELELNALTTMTLHSVALAPERSVASLDGIDAATAMSIANAEIVTADQLAVMEPAAVAAAAGISLETAERAVTEARAASGGALAIGAIAGASAVIGTAAAGSTAGAFLEMSDEARATAAGGNAGRANAIAAGIHAGLALRGAGLH